MPDIRPLPPRIRVSGGIRSATAAGRYRRPMTARSSSVSTSWRGWPRCFGAAPLDKPDPAYVKDYCKALTAYHEVVGKDGAG